MLEHLSNILPYLDCVKTYLDSMQIEYLVLPPYSSHIGTCDPLSELVTSEYMVLGIKYGGEGLRLTIRKDCWK